MLFRKRPNSIIRKPDQLGIPMTRSFRRPPKDAVDSRLVAATSCFQLRKYIGIDADRQALFYRPVELPDDGGCPIIANWNVAKVYLVVTQ